MSASNRSSAASATLVLRPVRRPPGRGCWEIAGVGYGNAGPSRGFAMLARSLSLLLLALPAAAAGPKVGEKAGMLPFTDTRSLPRTLDDFGKKQAFVVVFTSTSCPLAQRYLPTLIALEKEYRPK